MIRDALERYGAAFGSGMGEGETCGAVTGSLMVLGLRYGHSGAVGNDCDVIKDVSEKFKEKFVAFCGSLKCEELLGVNVKYPEGLESARKSGVFQLKCPVFIKEAIAIIDSIQNEN